MKECPYCHAGLPDEAQFCAGCGNPISVNNAAPEETVNYAQNEAFDASAPYQQPMGYYPQPIAKEDVKLGKWVLYQLIPFIPVVGSLIYLIMLFVWGFGSDKNETFRNWAKSQLILAAIGLAISILLIVLFAVFVATGASVLQTLLEDGAYYGY